MGVGGANTRDHFGDVMQPLSMFSPNLIRCYSYSDLTLRISRRNLLAGSRTTLARPPTKRIAPSIFLEQTVDQHKYIMSSI